MLKRILKQSLHRISPRGAAWVADQVWAFRLAREARALRRSCDRAPDLGAVADQVLRSRWFGAIQKKSEILPLLIALQRSRPRRLCEIGAAQGGTLALFSQVAATDARLLSIDLNFAPARIRSHRHLVRPRQRVTCLRADSHSPATVETVKRWLGDQALDFLFIDGDHTLAGVATDHRLYAPLVRAGGLVAFHDIVPDFKTRHGIVTPADVGEVPAFWQDLKRRSAGTRELIEEPGQDGFGIGVVGWPEEPA